MIKKSLLTIISLSILFGSLIRSMDNSQQSSEIKLRTSDNQEISCPQNLYYLSMMINNTIEAPEELGNPYNPSDPIPLHIISKEQWNLLFPLLKLIHNNDIETIGYNLHEWYDLQNLVKLLNASNFLDVRKIINDEDEIILLEIVAEEIAAHLSTESSLTNVLKDEKFLKSIRLNSGQLIGDLSKLLAQKMIECKTNCHAKLLQSCPISNKILQGHDRILSVALNQSGNKVITAYFDGTAQIWNVKTGKCLHTLQEHIQPVVWVTFNPAGDRAATASFDGTARIWDIETGNCLHILQGHEDWVYSAAFDKSGDKIITTSYDKTARIWDAKTGKYLQVLQEHTREINSASFNHLGTKIATASDDKTARIWDSKTGKCLHVLQGHNDRIYSVAFDKIGENIVTASHDNTIRIWNVETGKCLHILDIQNNDGNSAAFSNSGNKVATGSLKGKTRIWDVKTGKCLHSLYGHTDQITSIAFNQTGDKIVTVPFDNTARIWDLNILLSCEQYLKNITLEQASLLTYWHLAQSNDKMLNLKNSRYLSSIFESIDNKYIKKIVETIDASQQDI